jgi:hypothetical protein
MRDDGARPREIWIGIANLAFALAVLLPSGGISVWPAGQDEPKQQFRPASSDVVHAKGFPTFGKWMISPHLTYSDWLGATLDGKRLREPLNVIIVDPFAGSEEEAVIRFLEACARAGFTIRPEHSSGYYGWLCGRLYPQIPAEKHHALSDEPFEFHNNHGRFFGPCFSEGRYYFIGALSREKLVPATKAEHEYVSFNQARDKFAFVLTEKGGFKVTTFLNLENVLLDDPAVCTGDHDGFAVVLTAIR